MNEELNEAIKRFILVGTDNNGYKHRYTIIKNESFKNAFIGFMNDLGFDKDKVRKEFISEKVVEDEKGDKIDKVIVIKISDLIDICSHYQNQKYDIDVFYGNDKIIILVRVIDRNKLIKEITKHKWKDYSKESAEKLLGSAYESPHLNMKSKKFVVK